MLTYLAFIVVTTILAITIAAVQAFTVHIVVDTAVTEIAIMQDVLADATAVLLSSIVAISQMTILVTVRQPIQADTTATLLRLETNNAETVEHTDKVAQIANKVDLERKDVMIIQIEIVPLGLEIVNQITTIANLETTNAIGTTLLLKEETLTRTIQIIVRSEATAVRLEATAVRLEAATAALSAQVVLIQRHNPTQHQTVSLILVVHSEDIDKRKHICA